jgi:hypothetical protein
MMNRLLILLVALTIISGCKKSNDNVTYGPAPASTTGNAASFTATVNGMTTHDDSAYAELDFDTVNNYRFFMVFSDMAPTFIFTGFGDYIMSTNISNINYNQPQGAQLLYSDTFAVWTDYIPQACNFRITTVNYSAHTISGNFSGVVVYDGIAAAPHDTVVVSNGSFTNVPYTTSYQ